ncbi:MAG: tRNA (adenosine(37)-N6)-dimethylallyltransferase MiaA [Candidatus Krumholzibacteriales bacterium]
MKGLVILGPTAAGKSGLALEISQEYRGEIVCIDSRTVYRKIDIGTAKPTPDQRETVPHHMLDLLDLDQKCDAVWFAKEARKAVADISARGRMPVLVGGAGFYLKAVLHGLFDIDLYEDEREEFASRVSDTPTRDLYEQLSEIDRGISEKIHENDRYRIIRALEVYNLSGTPLSEHIRNQTDENEFGLEAVKIGLNSRRKIIHQRINRRTAEMIERGWIDEVRGLLNEGIGPELPGMQTIGYQEIISYLGGEIDLESCVEKISAATRQYAKRQLTWFRKEDNVKWLDINEDDPLEEVSMILDKEWPN